MPIRLHRAPVPVPFDEPFEEEFPGEQPVPQEEPVPDHNPEVATTSRAVLLPVRAGCVASTNPTRQLPRPG
jgi:hypothetical protein